MALRDVDEVRGRIVAQQAARAKLDMGEAGRAVPASTSFAEVDDRLRSEASLAWAVPAYPFREVGRLSITQAMPDQIDKSRKRIERAAFQTDRLLVVGDVTLPPEGYQSRFSDLLNRSDLEFLPLTNCQISSLVDGETRQRDFVMLSKRHIRVAYPVEGPGEG